MYKLILLNTVLFALLFNLSSCGSSHKEAKNIILFIGDGMGEQQRLAAQWVDSGLAGQLVMDDMSHMGFIATKSANSLVTDSAAAATAIATGVKTNNGVVSFDSNLNFISTILEIAKKRGKRTGLVTTTQVTHATPAAFATHVTNRGNLNEIALQLLSADLNVLLGGGENSFLPTSEEGCFVGNGARNDSRNLINEFVSLGYKYVCDASSLNSIDSESESAVLGLFSNGGMVRPFSPTLKEMTQSAISILSKGSNGFFLMVEGGQIDWAGHLNDAENVISDVITLDGAVDVARKFNALKQDTLIIVVADHETGGMFVTVEASGVPDEDGPFFAADGASFFVNWTTDGHTSVDVPITSEGPGSELLTGLRDNTYIFDVMLRSLGPE